MMEIETTTDTIQQQHGKATTTTAAAKAQPLCSTESAYQSWDATSPAQGVAHEASESLPTLYVSAMESNNLYLLDEPPLPKPAAPPPATNAFPRAQVALDSEGCRYSDPLSITDNNSAMDIDGGYIGTSMDSEIIVKAGAYGATTNLYLGTASTTNYLTTNINEDANLKPDPHQNLIDTNTDHDANKKPNKPSEEAKLADAIQDIQSLDATKLKEAMVRIIMKQQAKLDTHSPISIPDLVQEYKSMIYFDASDNKMAAEKPVEKKDPFSTVGNREWNTEFQSIRKEVLQLMDVKQDPMAPDPQLRTALEKVEKLTGDFYYAAKCYARIIISELCLPDCQKTIAPVNVGGLAGGEKYIVKGILFKFALDQLVMEKPRKLWMYGGTERNDRLAIKAAAKEFTALQIFVALASGKLCYPLMALIDYKGFRMIATILLPIDKTTLIYGSNDSGKTVHSSVHEVNDMMAELADYLHLKGHFVGTSAEKAKFIYGPGDIEVHQGKDGQFYALDFGRLLPPEAPVEDPELMPYEKRSVFYKFLRPEHLIVNCASCPLSSDSFSAWSNCDTEKLQNETNLKNATKDLYETAVPVFVSDLEAVEVDLRIPSYEDFKEHLFMKVRLSARARCNGLNMRHLGRVRMHTKSEVHRKLILSNCVARVIKRVIRDEMRIVMNNMMGTPTDRPFRMVVANIFNMILGHEADKSQAFWFHDVKVYLKTMFHYALTEEEKSIEFDLRKHIDMRTVVIETLERTNIILTNQANSELMLNLYTHPEANKNFVMIISDIMELAPRVRQLYSNYMYLSRLTRLAALESTNRDTAMRLLTSAHNLGIEATLAVPKCPITNLEISYVLICIISKQVSEYQALLTRSPTESLPRLKQEIEKNFDMAFIRCEESMATIPAQENFRHWANLAVHYANWKETIGEGPLVEVYKNKSEATNKISVHLNKEVACRLALKDVSAQYRSEGGNLTAFRVAEEEKYRAIHHPTSLTSSQSPKLHGVSSKKTRLSGVAKHRKPTHHPLLGVASFKNFKLQDV